MAARIVVFEPSTVCACAQVLWQQRTPLKKYFHPPANDAEIYIPKIWTLWCKWRVISGFSGRGAALQKGQPSSYRRLAWFISYVTKPFTWSPYHLLQTVYCSLCKRGNGGLNRSKSCYFVIVGSPTPKKKSFVNVFPSKPSKIMMLRFFFFFLKEVTYLSCVENCLCYETVLIFFQVNTYAESHHVHIQCTL